MPADRPSLEDILLHRWMLQVDVKLHQNNDQHQCVHQTETTVDVDDRNTPCKHSGAAAAMNAAESSVMNLADSLHASTISSLDNVKLTADLFSANAIEACVKPSSDSCIELWAAQSHRCVELCATDRCVEVCVEPSHDRCVELCAEPQSGRYCVECVEVCVEPSSDRCVELCAEPQSHRYCVECVELEPSCDRYVSLLGGPSSSHNVINLSDRELLSGDDRAHLSSSGLSWNVEELGVVKVCGSVHGETQKLPAIRDGYVQSQVVLSCDNSSVDRTALLSSDDILDCAATADSVSTASLKPS